MEVTITYELDGSYGATSHAGGDYEAAKLAAEALVPEKAKFLNIRVDRE